MKYQAIIFDMDGVIVDSEPLHLAADLETCKQFNLVVPNEEWIKVKGWKIKDIFQSFIDKYSEANISANEMVDCKAEIFLAKAKAELQVFPGVIDFIKFSRRHFEYVGLATTSLKKVQKFVFDRYELSEYFDALVTGQDVMHGKPDPEAYQKAVDKLGLDSKKCLVIEDSVNGVLSGKAAGCDVYAITNTYSKEELLKAGADEVFDSFIELQKYL